MARYAGNGGHHGKVESDMTERAEMIGVSDQSMAASSTPLMTW